MNELGQSGFRPLIGVSFCKLLVMFRSIIDIGGAYRFRPLIGVSFCKQKDKEVDWDKDFRFRPLIGVSFCKPYPLQALINQGLQGALACLKFNKRF